MSSGLPWSLHDPFDSSAPMVLLSHSSDLVYADLISLFTMTLEGLMENFVLYKSTDDTALAFSTFL